MFIRLKSAVAFISKNLKTTRNGQTLVEYGLILALVALVTVVAVTALGGQLKNLFSKVTSMIT